MTSDAVPDWRERIGDIVDGWLFPPQGTVHSVAAVHLEDQSLVDECWDDGVLGIDMETAALYAVAGTRSAEAVAMLTVSDVPVAGTAAEASALEAGAWVALHQALQLISDDPSAAS